MNSLLLGLLPSTPEQLRPENHQNRTNTAIASAARGRTSRCALLVGVAARHSRHPRAGLAIVDRPVKLYEGVCVLACLHPLEVVRRREQARREREEEVKERRRPEVLHPGGTEQTLGHLGRGRVPVLKAVPVQELPDRAQLGVRLAARDLAQGQRRTALEDELLQGHLKVGQVLSELEAARLAEGSEERRVGHEAVDGVGRDGRRHGHGVLAGELREVLGRDLVVQVGQIYLHERRARLLLLPRCLLKVCAAVHLGHRGGHLPVDRAAEGVEYRLADERVDLLEGRLECDAAGMRGLLVLGRLGRAVRIDERGVWRVANEVGKVAHDSRHVEIVGHALAKRASPRVGLSVAVTDFTHGPPRRAAKLAQHAHDDRAYHGRHPKVAAALPRVGERKLLAHGRVELGEVVARRQRGKDGYRQTVLVHRHRLGEHELERGVEALRRLLEEGRLQPQEARAVPVRNLLALEGRPLGRREDGRGRRGRCGGRRGGAGAVAARAVLVRRGR
mmetsp:Transcript_16990/g.37487  ORF Transcript_16990/g.37487 Transcript_16990/m.37487 type:complete len:504 (+) Transcript_16990:753-2264(+)